MLKRLGALLGLRSQFTSKRSMFQNTHNPSTKQREKYQLQHTSSALENGLMALFCSGLLNLYSSCRWVKWRQVKPLHPRAICHLQADRKQNQNTQIQTEYHWSFWIWSQVQQGMGTSFVAQKMPFAKMRWHLDTSRTCSEMCLQGQDSNNWYEAPIY